MSANPLEHRRDLSELETELEQGIREGVEQTVKETKVPTVPSVSKLPRSVAATALNIENQFPVTIEALEKTAEALRARADALDAKANYLKDQMVIAEDLRKAVLYEREFWEETISLGLVQVRARESQD